MYQLEVYENMSNAELMVCKFLQSFSLWWDYEQAVFVTDDKNRPRVWTPDFYLPDLGIYIEVVGNDSNPNYDFRKIIYNKNHIPIIFVYPYKDEDWQYKLTSEITQIHQKRWELIKRFNSL